MLFLGDDWAEDHHDVELVDGNGGKVVRKRLPEGLEGVTRLHALIAEHMPADWADLDPADAAAQVRIGIETDRGPWVQALLAAGYQVYAINPMSVARYRERHSTSGAKSDAGDAHVLAEIVRLDHAHHRPVAGDSAEAEAMKLVARTHQTLIWDRSRQMLRLRSALREFFPAALDAFDDLTAPDVLELLGRAPDPTRAARLSRSQIAAALRRANRRNIDTKAADLQQRLRAGQLRQPDAVQAAYAAIVTAQVRLIAALNAEVEQLGRVVADHFGRHRDADHYLSRPGLGVVLGARVLGEFGDDPHRFTDAKARKNYAGTSPITRASGTRKVVLARYARNRRLGDAVHQWAFCSLKGSPGARAYYDTLRARGTGHQAALRQLGNRLVGILHGCLKTGAAYDETTAWAHLHPSS
ncbi:IS110 family transposase [Micromonospora globispora]|uniref:IS110 family transposase n=1 Tax=Micromonospora globispora TaxID=1450148 RepID=A0A317K7B6_9ACTN|nr:IS110 family transposase [Micromonospora globispora]PWU47043.1 IS110 family transposase [Micromonospora globispora]